MLSSVFIVMDIPIALTMDTVLVDEVIKLVISKVLCSFSHGLQCLFILTITNHSFILKEELLDCTHGGVERGTTEEPHSFKEVFP